MKGDLFTCLKGKQLLTKNAKTYNFRIKLGNKQMDYCHTVKSCYLELSDNLKEKEIFYS